MPDDDLRAQLVELIDDAAPPVTLDEVRVRPVHDRPAPRSRRRTALVGIAVALVAAVGIAAVLRDRDTSATPPPATEATTTVSPPPTGRPTGDPVDALPRLLPSAIGTFHLPADLEIAHAVPAIGSLWLTGYPTSCEATCPSLYRLDIGVDTVVGIPGSTLDGLGVVFGDGSLFALSDRADGSPYEVTRIDIPSYRVRYTVDVPDTHVYGNTNPIGRIAFGFGSVWVYEGNDFVARLDAETGQQTARIELPPNTASNGLAVNSEGVWAIPFGGTNVLRIDPSTNMATVAAQFPAGFAQSIAADDNWVWTTHSTGVLDLARIDARDPTQVASAHIPTGDVAAGDGGVWFLGWVPGDKIDSPRNHPGLVGRIDPETLAVTGVTELPIGAIDDAKLAVGDGAAWVVDSTTHRAWRIDAG